MPKVYGVWTVPYNCLEYGFIFTQSWRPKYANYVNGKTLIKFGLRLTEHKNLLTKYSVHRSLDKRQKIFIESTYYSEHTIVCCLSNCYRLETDYC